MDTIFQVLTLAWTLQGGQYFNNAVSFYDAFEINNNFFVETSFELQVPFSWVKGGENMVFIGATTENQFYKGNPKGWTFSPHQDSFTFKTGMRLAGVEIGFEHQCVHPVISDGVPTSTFFSSYDKAYLKVDGSF